ncbi:hypothetical protein D7X33_51260, partial [Butyricicoccus sp. 1XD8-22]
LLEYMFSNHKTDTPFAKKDEINFLGAWIDNKLIGFIGILPFIFNFKGNKSVGCALTNWIVSENHRDSRAGLGLMKKVQEYSPKIILSLGINDNVAKLYSAMKWNVLGEVPRWIGIVNKKLTIEKILKNNPLPLRFWEEIKVVPTANSNYFVKEVNILDEEKWNQFYWEKFANKTVGFARD